MNFNREIQQKWGAILEHPAIPSIGDSHKRAVVAQLLENTERALVEEARNNGQTSLLSETSGAIPTSLTGGVNTYDPVLISLVRRAMPNLIAYDICGVQPMTGPTGLIFALRPQYNTQTGSNNAFYNEAETGHSTYGKAADGSGNALGNNAVNRGTTPTGSTTTYNFASGANTAVAEALGTTGLGNIDFNQMAFSIDKVTVSARTRALKAEYTMELAQDLKAIHGLDAETELSTILSAEILAEINREIIRTINLTAKEGAVEATVSGTFDLDIDSNGRWSVEKFKGLMFQIERDANRIAKETRRGKGNIVICSSDVASALQMAGVLDYAPALNSNNLQVDDTGNTFAGVLNGRLRVYVDPYSVANYMTVGYKGASAFDAGLFYCPYVPLQMVRAVGQDSFQPKIGFKTRYGVVANPFSKGLTQSDGSLEANVNVYYRRVLVNNIL
jgi:hypothetical protein